MQAILTKKLSESGYTLSDKEVNWLISHIGDSDPLIRDDLVFNLLAHSISDGHLTHTQFLTIVKEIMSGNLLFYGIGDGLREALTRSFTALIAGFVIHADGNDESNYYNLLSTEEKDYFFHSALLYLQKETTYIGYSPTYGWVHAIAHGADFLSKAACHPLFPKILWSEVLDTILCVIQRQETAFIDGEDRRLGHIIYAGLLSEALTQSLLSSWVEGLSFPLIENQHFYHLSMFENLLAYIYFHSLDTLTLEQPLKTQLLTYLTAY